MSDSGLGVDVDVAKRNLGYALDLLRQTLTEPAFPQDQVERHVQGAAGRDRAGALGRRPARRAGVLGDLLRPVQPERPADGRDGRDGRCGHPRATSSSFHATASSRPPRRRSSSQATCIGLDVVAEVEGALGAWSDARATSSSPVHGSRCPRPSDRARVVVVDRPGSVQTEILVGCPGPDRHVEGGWAPYPVLGFVVGGSPTARVDAVLREEKGYTYGIRCRVPAAPQGRPVPHVGQRPVRDVTVESVGPAHRHPRRGAGRASRPEETRRGADFIAKTAPGRYATADAIADEAAGLVYDGLTTEFTTALNAEIRDIDHERLGTAYRRFVDGQLDRRPGRRRGRFVDGVRGLGRGDVTVVPN